MISHESFKLNYVLSECGGSSKLKLVIKLIFKTEVSAVPLICTLSFWMHWFPWYLYTNHKDHDIYTLVFDQLSCPLFVPVCIARHPLSEFLNVKAKKVVKSLKGYVKNNFFNNNNKKCIELFDVFQKTFAQANTVVEKLFIVYFVCQIVLNFCATRSFVLLTYLYI